MLPILIGAGALLAITKTRPSTVLRMGEDMATLVGRSTIRGPKRFAHAVRIEYNARQLARHARIVEQHDAALAKMTKAQRIAHDRDVEAITSRAIELRTKR